jgi:hypothetical protein
MGKVCAMTAQQQAHSKLQHNPKQDELQSIIQKLQANIAQNKVETAQLEHLTWEQAKLAQRLTAELQAVQVLKAEELAKLWASANIKLADTRRQARQEVQEAQQEASEACNELQQSLDKERARREAVDATNSKQKRKIKALQKQVKRRKVAIEEEEVEKFKTMARTAHEVFMKKKGGEKGGWVKPVVRELIRWMASHGIATTVMNKLMHKVLATWNLNLKDHVSKHTISQAILEGLIIAKLQIGYELLLTDCEYSYQYG